MSDDPIDAFDRIAEDVRRRENELDAADKLRVEKRREPTQQPHGKPGDVEPPEPPTTD